MSDNSPPRPGSWPDPPALSATERIAASLKTLREWESTEGFFRPSLLMMTIAIRNAQEALEELLVQIKPEAAE